MTYFVWCLRFPLMGVTYGWMALSSGGLSRWGWQPRCRDDTEKHQFDTQYSECQHSFSMPASEEHIMSTWLCAPLDRWADVISEQEISRTEIFPAGWGTWKLFQEEQKRSVTLSKVGTDTFEKWVAYKRKLKEKDDERIKLLFQSLSHSRESSFVIFLGVLLQSLPHPDTPLIAACTH